MNIKAFAGYGLRSRRIDYHIPVVAATPGEGRPALQSESQGGLFMFDRSDPSRRSFLTGGALFAASIATGDIALGATPVAVNPGAQQALQTLMAGNARFVADKSVCSPLSARRRELVAAQHPFAIILSCSDSRVPVETVFDQDPGNIFGVRIAGNFVDEDGLASIEYGVEVLESSLLLVLGHTGCGAVKATVTYAKDGTKEPSRIQRLVEAILPAVSATKGMSGDWAHNAEIQNVRDNVKYAASASPITRHALERKTLSIAGGIYDLDTGRVTIIT